MNPQYLNENLIAKLSFEFGLAVIKFCDILYMHKKFVIANQLLRSGLSIGANIREAQNAESPADFIHKMKISSKEGDESEFYLLLISKAYQFSETEVLLQSLGSINRILNKIILTAKENQKKNYQNHKANRLIS